MRLGKNKILITGGTGYLGYEIANHLSKKYNIISTSKRKRKNFLHLKIKFLKM